MAPSWSGYVWAGVDDNGVAGGGLIWVGVA